MFDRTKTCFDMAEVFPGLATDPQEFEGICWLGCQLAQDLARFGSNWFSSYIVLHGTTWILKQQSSELQGPTTLGAGEHGESQRSAAGQCKLKIQSATSKYGSWC